MPFYTDNPIERVMVANSFGPRFDPQSIPSYDDWVVNNTFDPFGPEPFVPTSCASPGIPIHFRTRHEFHLEEGMDVNCRFDRGCGSSEVDMTRNLPQERSRFRFAQKRIERTTDVNVSQVPATHRLPSGQSRIPVPIKATPTTVSRVVGPRPFRSQHAFHAGREPPLAVPKAVYPLPTWLTHFEDYEEELLTEFCPPSKDSSLSTSNFPLMVGVEPHPDRVLQCPPRDWYSEEDEDFDEEDEDYDLFELDVNLDFESDRVSFGSESSAPSSYYGVDAGDWLTPYQDHITGGEGYPRASAVTFLGSPPKCFPSLPSSGPRAPSFDPFDRTTTRSPEFIPWSGFTNPFTGVPITETPLPRSSVAQVSTYDGDPIEAEVDRFLLEVEEGLGFRSGSGLGSESSHDPEGWYNRFDPTGYTSQVPPQEPKVLHVDAGFKPPPLMHTTTNWLPDLEEGEDAELDAVVISSRTPAPW